MSVPVLRPVIDYTSRDYESIRADMIRLIRARIPQWTADNPADFGVALVEAFAYATDTLHYYLDRVANEAYLSTAVQRESLYAIANMFNYAPRLAAPARVALTFANATERDVIIPKGTRVQASVAGASGAILKNFETDTENIIPAGTAISDSRVQDIAATEGRTYYDETLGVSTGFISQQFPLPRTSVLQNTVTVTTSVGDGDVTPWREIDRLIDADENDRVFQVIRQTDDSSVVRFGDGINGAIPGLHAVIRASYRVGGGTSGNVPPFAIDTLVEPVLYGVTVFNEYAAYGGRNAESLDSIRINAARSFRSRDRAVTLSDYVAVAEAMPGIAKAKAVGHSGSSVTVYAAPDDLLGDRQPNLEPAEEDVGYDEYIGLQETLTSRLQRRSMAGVSIQVFGAEYQPFYLSITATCDPTADADAVRTEILDNLAYYFRWQNVDFNQVISVQTIFETMIGIEGLAYAEIQGLDVVPDPVTTQTLDFDSMAVNLIPYYDVENVALTMVGGAAS